jgi:hypothetical protein
MSTGRKTEHMTADKQACCLFCWDGNGPLKLSPEKHDDDDDDDRMLQYLDIYNVSVGLK